MVGFSGREAEELLLMLYFTKAGYVVHLKCTCRLKWKRGSYCARFYLECVLTVIMRWNIFSSEITDSSSSGSFYGFFLSSFKSDTFCSINNCFYNTLRHVINCWSCCDFFFPEHFLLICIHIIELIWFAVLVWIQVIKFYTKNYT